MTGLGQVGALGRLGAPALARGGWWLSGSELDLYFANNRAFNRSTGFSGSPNGILTYTAPSPKMVYGDDGVLRYAPHNLFPSSSSFTINSAQLATFSANSEVNPQGLAGAFKLTETNSNGQHYVNISTSVIAGYTYAITFYAKAAERSIVNSFTSGGLGGASIRVNLATGAIEAGSGVVTNAGNGWWRIKYLSTATSTSGQLVYFSIYNGAGSYQGDGSSGLLLWGPHVFTSPCVDETYLPTTGSVKYSLPINHNPTTFAPLGVLIEEQRTNLLTYSEQFDNAAWTKGEATVSANAATSPNGTASADKLVESVNIAEHYVLQAFAVVSGTTYTCTVFAKAGERSWLRVFLGANIGNGFAWVNLATGAVGTTSGSPTVEVTDVGDGWYRIAVTKAATGTGSTSMTLLPGTADNTASYDGDGTSGLYLWGAQLEAGAFATSYIPTVASQVTRAADNVSILTSAFAYNAAAGTCVVEADVASVSAVTYLTSITNGTAGELFGLRYSSSNPEFLVIDNSATQVQIDAGTAVATQNKLAAAWAANDFVASYGGAVVVTDVSGTLPTPTTLYVGSSSAVAAFTNGHIKRLTYFPTRKTNAELQALSA